MLNGDYMIDENARVLEQEIDWFSKILDTRIRLHFGHECSYSDIYEIQPPELNGSDSMYAGFVKHYDFPFAERLIFILSIIPHVKPQILDVFFTKNSENSRYFTEFGGGNGLSFQGFLPTGETAMFLLAGDDLEKRLSLYYLFDADHYFTRLSSRLRQYLSRFGRCHSVPF